MTRIEKLKLKYPDKKMRRVWVLTTLSSLVLDKLHRTHGLNKKPKKHIFKFNEV